MRCSKLFIFILLAIGFACSNNDQETSTPQLEVTSESAVKPDSTLQIEVTVVAPGLLTSDVITGELVSGEGELAKTNFVGGNMGTGNATFDFTAGSTENSRALLRFRAMDLAGQEGSSEIEIEITSLEFKRVLVINEGNFFSANGSLDVFDIASNQIEHGVFPANATIQQVSMHEEMVYLVTNAPDRLDILNDQFESVASVDEGLDNPIDFAAIGNTGYISNWGDINTAFTDNPDSYVAIIDLESYQVTDSILLDDRPENLLVYDDKVYVALEGGSSVAVIDPATLVMDEITVPAGPSNMVVDDLGMIWVLCTSGSLVEIDPSTASTGVSIDGLTTAGYREKLSIDGTGHYLYFLAGGNDSFTGLTKVYKVDLRSQQVDPIIKDGVALYGLGVNPESGHVYLGDSNAFQSTGTAFIYNSGGNKLDEFATGIGPKGFLFMRN